MRITVDSNCSGAPISPLTRGINLEVYITRCMAVYTVS